GGSSATSFFASCRSARPARRATSAWISSAVPLGSRGEIRTAGAPDSPGFQSTIPCRSSLRWASVRVNMRSPWAAGAAAQSHNRKPARMQGVCAFMGIHYIGRRAMLSSMTMTNEEANAWIEHWCATTPENKLELIDGRFTVSTIAGSRRIAWTLLQDYGPAMALPLAPAELWWEALRRAFHPQPTPGTPEEWAAWAASVEHDPEPPPAG